MSTYQEKLKDPRWQKKRLEIMERDNFECQLCKDKLSTLTVHHIYYLGYIDPWEYDDHMLVTICEKCHHEEHDTYQFEDPRFNNRQHGLMNIEFNNLIVEFLCFLHNPLNASPNVSVINLPGRLVVLRSKKQKEFIIDFQKSFEEWLKNQTHENRLSAYEAHKKTIGEQYLKHQEYEEKIKQISEKLGL